MYTPTEKQRGSYRGSDNSSRGYPQRKVTTNNKYNHLNSSNEKVSVSGPSKRSGLFNVENKFADKKRSKIQDRRNGPLSPKEQSKNPLSNDYQSPRKRSLVREDHSALKSPKSTIGQNLMK